MTNIILEFKDAQLVVDKLKSGFLHPTDKEFEDYTQPQTQRSNTLDASENSQRNSINLTRHANKKLGWLFGSKKVRSCGISFIICLV